MHFLCLLPLICCSQPDSVATGEGWGSEIALENLSLRGTLKARKLGHRRICARDFLPGA